MTTLYEFCVGFTKLGVGAAPSSAPTIKVVDSADNVLVNAGTATTALANLVGAYRYSYSGADGLTCYAKFSTTDLTVDQYDIFTAALINPVVRDIQTRIPAALTANGNMKSSLLEILTTALTETSGGYLAAGLKKLLDVATPLMTVATVPSVAGDAMDLVSTLKHVAGTSGYDRTTDSLEALGTKTTSPLGTDGKVLISTDSQDVSTSFHVDAKLLNNATPNNLAAGATMDLVDALKHKSGASGYDRTTDSMEALGENDATLAAITALNNLSAANVRTAVGLATANLDTQLSTIDDYLDTEVAAIKAKTDQLVFTRPNQVDATAVTGNVAGVGAIQWTYNVLDNLGIAVADVEVWVTSDLTGLTVLANGTTDASGNVIFWLDAGSVYVWCKKSGYNFSNPDLEVVV